MKASERPRAGDYVERCPLLYVMELIGSKWKLPILWCLNEEDGLHYNELKRRVHGVTNTMLTKCLRELEEKGLVSRRSLGSVPPSVTYHLREDGKALCRPWRGCIAGGWPTWKNGGRGHPAANDRLFGVVSHSPAR